MKILLIAGHGAGDPGAVAKIDGVTYQEAKLTRDVVSMLKPLLEQYGAIVGVYPTSHDAYTDYKNGKLVGNANFSAYDYILEIHFNAGASDLKGNGKTTGVECFWPSRGKETGVELPITSRLVKLGYKQRQNRSGQYAVINTAAGYGKKANLLEVCFIDDADDMKIYLANKKQIAQNIADGVASYFKLQKKEEVIHMDMTKAELTKLIDERIQKAVDDPSTQPSNWAIKEWAQGKKLNITDGTRPKAKCTREEVVALILRAIGKSEVK